MSDEEKPDRFAPQVEIEAQDDKMKCSLIITGRYNSKLSYEFIIDYLNELHITFGIKLNEISKIINQYHKDHSSMSRISETIAVGKDVIEGENGSIEILVKKPEKVVINDYGKADFRNVQHYVTVKEGEKLALRKRAIEGTPGFDIYGEIIKPEFVSEATLDTGENVTFDETSNYYIANVKGIFIQNENYIDVEPVLKIDGNVGLESGNINYDGDVSVSGNIERGSRVNCTGDLNVEGMVESGFIRVSKNMTVLEGINTRNEGTIIVKGELSSTYIDNSTVIVENNIHVKTSITGSKVTTCLDLLMPSKSSVIAGSEITVYGDIICSTIGNRNEVKTFFTLGLHFKNMQFYNYNLHEFEEIDKNLKSQIKEVEKIKTYVQNMAGKKIAVEKATEMKNKFEVYKQTVQARQKAEHQLDVAKLNRFNPRSVTVKCRGTINKGVEFHYMRIVETINAPLQFSTLTFKPEDESFMVSGFND